MKFHLRNYWSKNGAALLIMAVLLLSSWSTVSAAPSTQDVERRLALVESYLNSNTAYDIAQGENKAAIEFLRKAEVFLQQGLDELNAGNLDLAAESADQSIRAYKAASQAARGKKSTVNPAANKALYAEIETYYQAFMAALQEKGPASAGLLNQGQYKRLMKQAKAAEKQGDGSTAVNRLNQAKIMVINALTKIRSNETVVYSKEFQTPADEYRYEDGRYAEYASLAQKMLAQEDLDERKLGLLKSLQHKAETLRAEAESSAASGDFNAAIDHMEQALKKLVQGLRMLGLPVSL